MITDSLPVESKILRKIFFKSSTIVMQVTKVPVGGPSVRIDDESNGGFELRQVVPEHVDTLESRALLVGDEYNER